MNNTVQIQKRGKGRFLPLLISSEGVKFLGEKRSVELAKETLMRNCSKDCRIDWEEPLSKESKKLATAYKLVALGHII